MQDEPVGLFTDLYELTMADSYLDHGVEGEAVFDLHVRSLPPGRGFMVAGGTARLAERLDQFTFSDEDLAFLEEQGFSDDLLGYLEEFSFEGEVRVVPEGEIVYPYEPLAQVRAPLPMAQLVETLVLNTVHLETVLATKAAHCYVAKGRPEDPGQGPAMVDFGARRAHGTEAAHAAARAAYVGGFQGTSLVSAAREMQIPCFGTMAHSYVEAFPDEGTALASFARSNPDGTTLLIDTYDTVEGAHTVVELADELASEGVEIGGVRIDSGDLDELAREVRSILDEAGLEEVDIFLSGGLDEHAIARFRDEATPADGYGIGTSLVVSSDAPSLDISYKLVEYEGEPVVKTSPGKHTLPGAKQVHRRYEQDTMVGDTIAGRDEDVPGRDLLEPLGEFDPVTATRQARERFLDAIQQVPDDVARLEDPAAYPVERSQQIDAWLDRAVERVDREPEPAKRPLELRS